jgi:hypothetical protein
MTPSQNSQLLPGAILIANLTNEIPAPALAGVGKAEYESIKYVQEEG